MNIVHEEKTQSSTTTPTSENRIPLEELATALGMTTARLKWIDWQLAQKGIESGIVRREDGWWADPQTFHAHYISGQAEPHIRYVATAWTGNDLLNEQGIFFLRDVCELLPFTPNQLRYQSQKLPDPRREIGIWKDQMRGGYLVDMSVFAPWIIEIWEDKGKTS